MNEPYVDDEKKGEPEPTAPRNSGIVPAGLGLAGDSPISVEAETRFTDLLEEAEALVHYAASSGIELDSGVRRAVFVARRKPIRTWTEGDVGDLLAAMTEMSQKLRPVTGESARKSLTQGGASKVIGIAELVVVS
jgi:hypothetical protein